MKTANTLFVSLLIASSALSARELLQESTETYQLQRGGSIDLENVNGNIEITAWNSPEVEVVYKIYGDSKKALDNVEVIINDRADSLEIEVNHEESNGWWGKSENATVAFELRVPEWAMLDSIETVNGDVDISGVAGEVNASTVNGDVNASDLASEASFSTVNGDIEARFTNYNDQDASFDSVNGDVNIYIPSSANAKIRAETVHGSIKNDFGLEVDKGFVGQDMKASLGNGDGRISLETVNGSIRVRESNVR